MHEITRLNFGRKGIEIELKAGKKKKKKSVLDKKTERGALTMNF